MAWTKIGADGWIVNQDALYAVFRSAEFARLSNTYTTIEKKSSFWGPTTYEAVTDFVRVKTEAAEIAHRNHALFLPILQNSPETAFRSLCNLIEQTRFNKERIKTTRSNALNQSMANIDKLVGTYEDRVAWLKFTQKTSILVLSVIPASGAINLVRLGLQAGLEGAKSYQNSNQNTVEGRVGEALFSGVSSVVTGFISIAKGANKAEKIALLFVEAGMDGLQTGTSALISGKSTEVAIRRGLTTAGSNAIAGQLTIDIPPMNSVFEAVTKDLAGKMVRNAVVGGTQSWVNDNADAPPDPTKRPQITGELTALGTPVRSPQIVNFVKENLMRRLP